MTAAPFNPLVLVAALATSLMIVSCGSDDIPEANLSKAEYAKQADLICSDAANVQARKAGAYLRKHPGAEEEELVEGAAIPPLEAELEELKELGLPRGDEEEAEAFLDELGKAIEEVKREPKAALSEDGNPFDQANELGRKLKLGDCSRHP